MKEEISEYRLQLFFDEYLFKKSTKIDGNDNLGQTINTFDFFLSFEISTTL